MKRFLKLIPYTMFFLALIPHAYAAGTGKVDSLLQQAIKESAQTKPEPKKEISQKEPAVIAKPVVQQQKPESSIGFRLGGFRLIPQLSVTRTYDDNIFAQQSNEQDDYITHIIPSFRMNLEDSAHDVEIAAHYEQEIYDDLNDNDQQNFGGHIKARLNASKGLSLPISISYLQSHEDRVDDLTLQLSKDPLRYDDFAVSGGFAYKPDRLGIEVLGHYQKQRFEDGFTAADAAVIRSDADRDIVTGEVKLSYDTSNRSTIMLSGSWGERDYQKNNFQGGGFNGPDRTSEIYTAMAGWKLDLNDVSISLNAGYADHDYDAGAINDQEEIVADTAIRFNLNDHVVFNMSYIRDVYEDEEIIQPIIRNNFETGVDIDVNEKLLLGLKATYGDWDFDGLNRQDEIITGGINLDYLLNQNISMGLEYMVGTRDSDAANLDYDRNVVMARLSGRL